MENVGVGRRGVPRGGCIAVCAATSAHNEQQPDGFAGQKVMKRVIDSGDSVVRLKAQTPSGERS